MNSTFRRTGFACIVLALCGCMTEVNGFHTDIIVIGLADSFDSRTISVEGVVLLEPGESVTQYVVRSGTICTSDAASFRTDPLEVLVKEGDRVLSETVIKYRACRDVQHRRFDGFVEQLILVLRPDGTLVLPDVARSRVDIVDPSSSTNTRQDDTGAGSWEGFFNPTPPRPSASCSGPSPLVRVLAGHRVAGPERRRQPCRNTAPER